MWTDYVDPSYRPILRTNVSRMIKRGVAHDQIVDRLQRDHDLPEGLCREIVDSVSVRVRVASW